MAVIKHLIDYLPNYMRDYKEMQTILGTEEPEVNLAWDGLSAVWNNQFLFDSDETGVKRWESMLDITPKLTDTLYERKFRIFSMLNQELPYTRTKLEETLDVLCGDDGYQIVWDESNYSIIVKLGLENKSNRSEVEKGLLKMIPANMITLITILYNRYSTLQDYTHEHLSSYTHEELRNEVIS